MVVFTKNGANLNIWVYTIYGSRYRKLPYVNGWMDGCRRPLLLTSTNVFATARWQHIAAALCLCLRARRSSSAGFGSGRARRFVSVVVWPVNEQHLHFYDGLFMAFFRLFVIGNTCNFAILSPPLLHNRNNRNGCSMTSQPQNLR